jgi:DNA-binding protein HU-beta
LEAIARSENQLGIRSILMERRLTSGKIYEELKNRRRRGEAKDEKGVLDTLREIGKAELNKAGVFLVPGFAKFVVVKKPATKARRGVNPSTGEVMMIKAKPGRKIVRVELIGKDSPESTRDRRKSTATKVSKQARRALPEPLFVLEIRAMAERVFGDERKAEAWLSLPNASLSSQVPAELLTDDLGAAVVRETLERIDHGIFA